MEIQSVSGLCHGFVKSPGAQISLCSFLSINSITFPLPCVPTERPWAAPRVSCAHPELDTGQHRVTERGWGWNWGVCISISHFLQRSAEFLFPSEIKITLIRLFLFCNTFFHCCMISSPCLEPNYNGLSPCFQSSILWGKRKQGNHTAGTRASFFIYKGLDVFQRGWFYSHPLVRTRGTFSGDWTGIWAPIKSGFH